MIGIYGGTFDPVHFGHLRPALEVQQGLALDEVRFIPAGQPPHRGEPHASVEQRLAMLNLAIADQPGFVIDEREIHRSGPSYMVDTLQSIREEVSDTAMALIMGFDAFTGLASWHQWPRIIELANIVITHRPGWSQESYQKDKVLSEFVSGHLCETAHLANQTAGCLTFFPVSQLEISATAIRQQVNNNQSIRYLLPDNVFDYIKQQGIYR